MSSTSSGGEAVADSAQNLDQGELVPEVSSDSGDESSHFVSEDDPLYQLRPQLTGAIDPARRKSVASGADTRKEDSGKRRRESSSGSEYKPPGPAHKKRKGTKKTKVQPRKQDNGGDSSDQAQIGEEDDSIEEADPQVGNGSVPNLDILSAIFIFDGRTRWLLEKLPVELRLQQCRLLTWRPWMSLPLIMLTWIQKR